MAKLKQARGRVSQRSRYGSRFLLLALYTNYSWRSLGVNLQPVTETTPTFRRGEDDGIRVNVSPRIEILDVHSCQTPDNESPYLSPVLLAFYLDIRNCSTDLYEFGFKVPLACQRIHAGGATPWDTVVNIPLAGLNKGSVFRINYRHDSAVMLSCRSFVVVYFHCFDTLWGQVKGWVQCFARSSSALPSGVAIHTRQRRSIRHQREQQAGLQYFARCGRFALKRPPHISQIAVRFSDACRIICFLFACRICLSLGKVTRQASRMFL